MWLGRRKKIVDGKRGMRGEKVGWWCSHGLRAFAAAIWRPEFGAIEG